MTIYAATNQEYIKLVEQSQKISSNTKKLKRHSLISFDYENSWCEEKPIKWVGSNLIINV